jgi:hypothetical protein
MRWRLMDKPGSSYRCVGQKSAAGALEAFAATRIADKHGSRLCYLMAAMSTFEAEPKLIGILRAELSLAAQSGADAALAWCPKSAPAYPAYRKAGFLPVPPRLRPIEINFGARALRKEAATAAESGARWCLSFLDSDTQRRPGSRRRPTHLRHHRPRGVSAGAKRLCKRLNYCGYVP